MASKKTIFLQFLILIGSFFASVILTFKFLSYSGYTLDSMYSIFTIALILNTFAALIAIFFYRKLLNISLSKSISLSLISKSGSNIAMALIFNLIYHATNTSNNFYFVILILTIAISIIETATILLVYPKYNIQKIFIATFLNSLFTIIIPFLIPLVFS